MNTNKSLIFSQFNKARSAAKKQAKTASGQSLDEKRVNRALGVLMSKQPRPYNTTLTSCNCPDHQRNPGIICKHIAARMIERRAIEEQLKKSEAVTVVNGKVFVNGEESDLDPAIVTAVCNRIAASTRKVQGGLAYRISHE